MMYSKYYQPLKTNKMIEQLLQGLQGQVGPELESKAGVSQSQMPDIMKIIGGVAAKEAGKEMLGGNLGNVMNLFSNNQNNDGANSLQSNITNGIVSNLISKLGLKKETAAMISSVALPVLMNMITKKNSETPDDDASPLEALFDTKGKSGGLGGLLGGLSGLLGK